MLFNEENVEFHQGEIKKIDLENQTVEICTNCSKCDISPKYDLNTYINTPDFVPNRRQAFQYNYLVLAMGSQPDFFGVAGADKYSYTLSSIKNSEDIKARIKDCRHEYCNALLWKKSFIISNMYFWGRQYPLVKGKV